MSEIVKVSRRNFLKGLGAGAAMVVVPRFPGFDLGKRRERIYTPSEEYYSEWDMSRKSVTELYEGVQLYIKNEPNIGDRPAVFTKIEGLEGIVGPSSAEMFLPLTRTAGGNLGVDCNKFNRYYLGDWVESTKNDKYDVRGSEIAGIIEDEILERKAEAIIEIREKLWQRG